MRKMALFVNFQRKRIVMLWLVARTWECFEDEVLQTALKSPLLVTDNH